MIITCKECNSSFKVDDSLIKETGSKVKCSKCENIFTAYPHSPEDDLFSDTDEQLLDSDGSSELSDLDSSLDDLFNDDESLETKTPQEDADEVLGFGLGLDPEFDEKEDPPELTSEAEESELALGDSNDQLDLDPGAGMENLLENTDDELDLGFELDADTNQEPAAPSIIDDELPDLKDLSALDSEPLTEDDTDTKLEDIELDLEAGNKQEVNEIPDAEMALEEIGDELDLSDLNLENDESSTAVTATGEDSEDLNLDLLPDQEDENLEVDETLDAEMALEEIDDELDLSDLDLEYDESSATETATGEDSEDPNLDLLLDEDDENQEVDEIPDAKIAAEESDEIDFLDLDLEGDDTPATEITSGKKSENQGLDPETIAGEAISPGDELDLSDLEEIIDSETDEPAENSAEAVEPDLELKNDQKTQASGATTDEEEDDALDFSDLEKMLEPDETPEVSAEDDDADELDLQFDIDEPVADVVDSTASNDAGDANQQDDLLDIEKMLEENEEITEEELESPLEMAAAQEDSSEDESDLELDFDIESELQEKEDLFNGSTTADEQLESNLLSPDGTDTSDDVGIEDVELEGTVLRADVTTDEFATDELLETSSVDNRTDGSPVADQPPLTPAAMMPKSRSKKPVLVALLLLLLASGVLIVPNMLGIKIPYISDIKIPYLSDLDIRIPYLSDKLNPKAKDVAGNLKIVPLGGTINARFVNDSQGNQRFVIHGKIKNDYDHPRSFIKVTGKIYQKGGKLVKSESVYCGNVLSDSEVAGMKIAAITKRLRNRSGDKKSNIKVKTGQTVPFMIVFDKLPQNLDEYTVEVDGSSL
ncbi:MAG: DUF3426 domain-containing protein [Desulfobacteraceae bacterium]|jgi:predicted Zn finger-like uncharacterized protein|nr:DUF3426 domain-containing protein [Desulfobacteraceae bacterium]